MSIFGVVCECNPYHSGHGKLISRAREMGAGGLVAVMSGDFVQRGEPAVMSKFDRAADLAEQGFGLVFELPVRYSLSSSERFTAASVGLLDALGAVDTVLFGSECGSEDLLRKASAASYSEETRREVSRLCSQGESYPAALQSAVRQTAGEEAASVLASPNDILACGYMRALDVLGSRMKAATFTREDDGLTAHGAREMILSGQVPDHVTERTACAVREGDVSDPGRWDIISMAALRAMPRDEFSELPDVSGGLDSRLWRAAREAACLEEFFRLAKTRSYTMSRVKRAAACAVLGIRGSAPDVPPYARLLAIGPGGREILSAIKDGAKVPVSENLAELAEISAEAAERSAEEERATDIYNIARRRPVRAGEDRWRRLIIRN